MDLHVTVLCNNKNWILYLFILYMKKFGFETQDRFFLVSCIHEILLVQPQTAIIILACVRELPKGNVIMSVPRIYQDIEFGLWTRWRYNIQRFNDDASY
jgi:hypothetical protein